MEPSRRRRNRSSAGQRKRTGTGSRYRSKVEIRKKSKAKLRIGRVIATLGGALLIVGGILFIINGAVTGFDFGKSIYEKSDEKILKYISRQTEKEIILPNITVDGIEVGGLTRQEAESKLATAITLPDEEDAIILNADNNSYTHPYPPESFGVVFNVAGALEQAYNFGRSGDDLQKISNFKSLETTTKDFPVMTYDAQLVRSTVDGIASGINVEAVDSRVSKDDGVFNVTPSTIGYSMDADKLYSDIISSIESRNFNTTIGFTVTKTEPKYTEEDFKYIDTVIGSCYSKYKNDGDENRLANLKNGCLKIDGVVLYPDEVFSTNEHFNPCTYENGWRSAATIVKGKLEDSIGGGMCQVSSALYQAVLEAELEVVERFNHSLKVGYADYAYDATLAGDYKDLKFKNTTGYPMYIEGYVTSSNVVVKLYGYEEHDAGHTIEFANKLVKTTPPEEPIVTEDDTKPEGYEEYTTTALDGKTYELYKYVYENGELVDTVKINTSTYLPRRAEITKGTMKEEPTEDMTTEVTTDIVTDSSDTTVEAPMDTVPDIDIIEEPTVSAA